VRDDPLRVTRAACQQPASTLHTVRWFRIAGALLWIVGGSWFIFLLWSKMQ
jgi:hypothetical protein